MLGGDPCEFPRGQGLLQVPATEPSSVTTNSRELLGQLLLALWKIRN